MSERELLVGIVLDEQCFTLEELAAACAMEPEWLERLVQEGLFLPAGGSRGEWRFGARALTRARRIRDIERAFDAVPELAALVADLLEEMDEMRATLRRRGIG